MHGSAKWDWRAQNALRDKYMAYNSQKGDKFFIVVDWPENTSATDDEVYMDEVVNKLREKHLGINQTVCAQVSEITIDSKVQDRYLMIEVFDGDNQDVEIGCVTIRLYPVVRSIQA